MRDNYNSSGTLQWRKKKFIGQLDIIGGASSRDVVRQ